MTLFNSPLHDPEHTKSYYAATQRDRKNFTCLEEDICVDVCVIGGGFSGVSTALELSERGYKVALLEGQRIGWGATGRNGGQIIGGYGEALSHGEGRFAKKYGAEAAETAWRMSVECVDIIRERVEKYNIDCDLTWGYFDAAIKPREMRGINEYHDYLMNKKYPHKLTLVDKSGMDDIMGTQRYIGGMINEGQGHVQVLDLCKGEARAAESLGAKIYETTLATRIDYGLKPKVHTQKGSVTADYVVLCGNAYASQLTPKLAPKLTKYLLPASSYVMATEVLPDELARDVMRKNYAVCDQRTALDYFRLSADNRLLFGGMANYSARDPSSIEAALRPKMLKVFPQLKDVKIDYEWGGHMGIGLNRVPQMGRLDKNVFYVQAYSGHGVAPTHMSGRIIAELICQQAERFDLMARVKHIPFPGGRLFRQPMLALGMLFYKIRDELL